MLATQPPHPSYIAVFHPTFPYRHELLISAPLPVGVRLHHLLQWLGIWLTHFIPHRLPPVPPWDIPHRTCDLRLTRYARGVTQALTYRRYFAEFLSQYPDHTAEHIHGSFLQGSTGSAFVYNGQEFSYCLHGFNSVYTAEMYALYRDFLFIRHQSGSHYFVCTDTLRAFQCLSGYSPDHCIVVYVLLQVSDLRTSGQSVVCCWVPGHCFLPGNEADDAAALHRPLVSDLALGIDVCSCLRRAILSSWQAEWDSARDKKLRVVKPSVQEWQSAFRAVRKDKVAITRLGIGHTRLTRIDTRREERRRLSVQTVVSILLWHVSWWTALVTTTPAAYHLDELISDTLDDNPCRVSNVLAFILQ
jgi:hypothetical protein